MREKDFSKIETKSKICINVFCSENKLVFQIYSSNLKLVVTDENKSYYVYIKDFDRFMFHKTKNKHKTLFCRKCLQCFRSRKVLRRHKGDCLGIDGVQSVRFEKGKIEFENYFKQKPVPFRVYVDSECNFKKCNFKKC